MLRVAAVVDDDVTVTALDILYRRWSVAIIEALTLGPLRFVALRRQLPSVTHKVLSQNLLFMVQVGVITRQPLSPARGIVYALTPGGRSLLPIIGHLKNWRPSDPATREWQEQSRCANGKAL